MASLNKVMLMGRLGADPETRRMNSGDPVVTMRLATSETWKDRNGERKERTEWHQVVIFNKRLCEVAEKYLAKGHLVYVEGMQCTRAWEDQSGQKRYTTEVVLKEFRGELQLMPQGGGKKPAGSPEDYGTQSQSTQRQPERPQGTRDALDDEIPF